MVGEVVAAVQKAQSEVASAVDRWHEAHRGALERRKESGRLREVLRTVLLAWREEADGRQTRSASKGAGRGGDTGSAWLSGRDKPRAERHPIHILQSQKETMHTRQVDGGRRKGRDPYKETGVYATSAEIKGMRLPREPAQSAVPVGSQARLLMMWVRLTGGPEKARRWRDRRAWEGKRPR